MGQILTTDFDFLCAKVRGLRSKLYAGPSLTALARLATSAAYFEQTLSGTVPRSHIQGQQALVTQHTQDLVQLAKFISGRRREAFGWIIRRYQIENLKALLRARAQKTDQDEIIDTLYKLPEEFALPTKEILNAKSIKALANAIPLAPIATEIMHTAGLFDGSNLAFFMETAVEKAFLEEGLKRITRISAHERQRCVSLIMQEITCHNILFIWRALHTYNLAPDEIQDFVIPEGVFKNPASRIRLFQNGDIAEIATALGISKALGADKATIATCKDLEAALQKWLYRSSKRLFTQSLFDFGLLVSFCYLKRFELQDLLRLSEAIRQGAGTDEAQTHLITVE